MNDIRLPHTLRLDIPSPGVAFSTGRGPEAAPDDPYSGFSVCHYTGDAPGHYNRCRQQLAESLSLALDRIVIPRQTHSDRVAVIDSVPVEPSVIEGVDALVTRKEEVLLCINTADCVPVVLEDPVARVIAAAHCGWRGVVNNLLPNVVSAMCGQGALSSRMRVAMGPSICPGCFEVGEEVAAVFRQKFPASAGVVMDPVLTGWDRPHIDLPSAITDRLCRLGVAADRITPPPACSRCNPMRFFSARAVGVKSSRTLTAVIMPMDLF